MLRHNSTNLDELRLRAELAFNLVFNIRIAKRKKSREFRTQNRTKFQVIVKSKIFYKLKERNLTKSQVLNAQTLER